MRYTVFKLLLKIIMVFIVSDMHSQNIGDTIQKFDQFLQRKYETCIKNISGQENDEYIKNCRKGFLDTLRIWINIFESKKDSAGINVSSRQIFISYISAIKSYYEELDNISKDVKYNLTDFKERYDQMNLQKNLFLNSINQENNICKEIVDRLNDIDSLVSYQLFEMKETDSLASIIYFKQKVTQDSLNALSSVIRTQKMSSMIDNKNKKDKTSKLILGSLICSILSFALSVYEIFN